MKHEPTESEIREAVEYQDNAEYGDDPGGAAYGAYLAALSGPTVQALRDDNKMHIDHLFETRVKVDQLEAVCAAMREALEFYQDLLKELKTLRALKEAAQRETCGKCWNILNSAFATAKEGEK